MKRWLVFVLFSIAACSSSSAPEQSPAPAQQAPPATDCVADCVAKNQMRAVSPEQIEADCKQSCEAR
jgi:hypothetical protein